MTIMMLGLAGFVVSAACRGPRGCTIDDGVARCDDHVAEVGDRCEGAGGHACSLDGTRDLGCVGGRFELIAACRGPRGCRVENDAIACDDELARADEPCRTVDDVACSEDRRAVLRCGPKRTWVLHRACGSGGCATSGVDVTCP